MKYSNHSVAEGTRVRLRHLPNLVGYYVSVVGMQNLNTRMWAYVDLNQREKCSAAMQADPELPARLAGAFQPRWAQS